MRGPAPTRMPEPGPPGYPKPPMGRPTEHPTIRPESNAAGIHLLSAGSSDFGSRFRTIGSRWNWFPRPFDFGQSPTARRVDRAAAPTGASPLPRYDARVTRPVSKRDPLQGVTRLLVDGTNLLHALSRGPQRQPAAALIGKIRGAIPLEMHITLVFDGPPERGVRNERIAQGLTVQYSGRYSADTILITLVADAEMMSESATATDAILVVTDDRELRLAIRKRGARTAGAAWLLGRLERPPTRPGATTIGNARPPLPPRIVQGPPGEDTSDQSDEPRWQPGRGATTKTGNGRRTPRRTGGAGGGTLGRRSSRGGTSDHRGAPGDGRG
jgi:YacP-like NYN domain